MTKEKPIGAVAIFLVSSTQIKEKLVFYYNDPEENFQKLKETGCLNGELELISKNLQEYMDIDLLSVNGILKRMLVESVDIKFEKKDSKSPSLHFIVTSEDYSLEDGESHTFLLESFPKERADYPITAEWSFPGPLVEIKSPMPIIKREENYVQLKANKGDMMGGIEKFKFFLSK